MILRAAIAMLALIFLWVGVFFVSIILAARRPQ